jgi:hypothetical protein
MDEVGPGDFIALAFEVRALPTTTASLIIITTPSTTPTFNNAPPLCDLCWQGKGEDSVWIQKVVRMRYEEKKATKKD